MSQRIQEKSFLLRIGFMQAATKKDYGPEVTFPWHNRDENDGRILFGPHIKSFSGSF